MIVKINPADVVAIPSDYNNAKGRTWRYVVVGELDSNQDAATVFNTVEVNTDYSDPTVVDADYSEDDEDYLDNNSNLDLDDLYENDSTEEDVTFTTSDGREFTATEILEAVERHGGQRAAARSLEVARSTLWGWLQKIDAL